MIQFANNVILNDVCLCLFVYLVFKLKIKVCISKSYNWILWVFWHERKRWKRDSERQIKRVIKKRENDIKMMILHCLLLCVSFHY